MSVRHVLLLLVLLGACAVDRPVHPMRLEGFPGAPYAVDTAWLREGARWEFENRLAEGAKELSIELVREGDDLVMQGGRRGGAILRARDGFLEIVFDGEVVERLLKLEGKVGDQWRAAGARYMVFGFDEIEVLGETRRALVVAAERRPVRDLYWFAPGLGIVRLRTEKQGMAKRDALLKAFRPGGAN